MLRVLNISEGTSVDGPGLRTSLYFAGCQHRCEGCHNPQSWAADGGEEKSDEELLRVIDYNDFPVTFSGGDPLFQLEGTARLAERIKAEQGRNIWCFTGYTWEQLMEALKPGYVPSAKSRSLDAANLRKLLANIDVLVDSPFILAQRDISLRFRGSGNQRIIDVPASLEKGALVDITDRF